MRLGGSGRKRGRSEHLKETAEKLAKRLSESAVSGGARLHRGLKTASTKVQKVVGKSMEEAHPRIKHTVEVLGRAGEKASSKARTATAAVRTRVASSGESLSRQGRKAAVEATNLLNAVLASDFAAGIEHWLGDTFNTGHPSVYDKAADAMYHATHIGGGQLHRLFDGSHTPWGMWEKVRDALPDDSFGQEVAGYFTALGKDFSSTVGLPMLDLTPHSYNQLADALSTGLGTQREWFADLLHINAPELCGAVTSTLALALNWSRAEVAQFGRLAAGSGISALASANPALGVVALVALAKAFMDARSRGEYSAVVEGVAKGGTSTGVLLASASIIGGPAWIGVMVGVCASVAAQKAMNRVDFAQVSEFVASSLRRALAARHNVGRARYQPA